MSEAKVLEVLTPATFEALLKSDRRTVTLHVLPALYSLIEGDRERLVAELRIALAMAERDALEAERRARRERRRD